MAKNRFSLDETMNDAKQSIEEAKKETPKQEPVQAAQPEPELPEAVEDETESAAEETGTGEGSAPEKEKESPKAARIRRNVRKVENRRNQRTVFLEDDTVKKLEDIKRVVNWGREKATKGTFISVIDLLSLAAREFVERNYKDICGE